MRNFKIKPSPISYEGMDVENSDELILENGFWKIKANGTKTINQEDNGTETINQEANGTKTINQEDNGTETINPATEYLLHFFNRQLYCNRFPGNQVYHYYKQLIYSNPFEYQMYFKDDYSYVNFGIYINLLDDDDIKPSITLLDIFTIYKEFNNIYNRRTKELDCYHKALSKLMDTIQSKLKMRYDQEVKKYICEKAKEKIEKELLKRSYGDLSELSKIFIDFNKPLIYELISSCELPEYEKPGKRIHINIRPKRIAKRTKSSVSTPDGISLNTNQLDGNALSKTEQYKNPYDIKKKYIRNLYEALLLSCLLNPTFTNAYGPTMNKIHTKYEAMFEKRFLAQDKSLYSGDAAKFLVHEISRILFVNKGLEYRKCSNSQDWEYKPNIRNILDPVMFCIVLLEPIYLDSSPTN